MTKAESLRDIEREVRAIVHRVKRLSVENAGLIDPDLPISAYAVLLFIYDNGPVRAQEVVGSIGADKATISRQIAQLEELGLATRRTDPSDKRAQTVELTAQGRAKVDSVTRQRRVTFIERLDDWSADELADFADQLSRYNASLER